jgi:ribonuclease-3
VAGKTGPDHAPHFTVEAEIAGQYRAAGEGASRRLAEQAAARALLAQIQNPAETM